MRKDGEECGRDWKRKDVWEEREKIGRFKANERDIADEIATKRKKKRGRGKYDNVFNGREGDLALRVIVVIF